MPAQAPLPREFFVCISRAHALLDAEYSRPIPAIRSQPARTRQAIKGARAELEQASMILQNLVAQRQAEHAATTAGEAASEGI